MERYIDKFIEIISSDKIIRIFVFIIFVFLLMPVAITFITAINPANALTFPPRGFSLKWFAKVLTDIAWLKAYKMSFLSSIFSSMVAMIAGTLYAYCHVRYRYRFRGLVHMLTLSPLAFPKIIMGVTLLMFFNFFGLVGTFGGLVLGLVIVAAPFVVQTVTAAMYNYDEYIEEAALSLGANEIKTFFQITLPLITPGLVAAGILAFIYTFGNLQIAIFLIGPDTITVPVMIFSAMEFTDDPSVAAVAGINILIVMIFIISTQKIVGAKALTKM